MIGLQLVTGFSLPSSGPLSLNEAKDHLRIELDFTADDAQVTRKLKSAIALIEEATGRSLLSQTFRQSLDRFPACHEPIRLARSPLVSVSAFRYVDANGDTQTLTVGDYYTDVNGEPGIIAPAANDQWPTDALKRQGSVVVEFSAGYSSNAVVPSPLVDAVYLTLSHLYENREAVVDWNPKELPFGVESIVMAWRVPELDYSPEVCGSESSSAETWRA